VRVIRKLLSAALLESKIINESEMLWHRAAYHRQILSSGSGSTTLASDWSDIVKHTNKDCRRKHMYGYI